MIRTKSEINYRFYNIHNKETGIWCQCGDKSFHKGDNLFLELCFHRLVKLAALLCLIAHALFLWICHDCLATVVRRRILECFKVGKKIKHTLKKWGSRRELHGEYMTKQKYQIKDKSDVRIIQEKATAKSSRTSTTKCLKVMECLRYFKDANRNNI